METIIVVDLTHFDNWCYSIQLLRNWLDNHDMLTPPTPLSLPPHKQNIQHWDWLFSIIAWINPQCVTNGNGWWWVAVAARLVCWYGIIHWTCCGNMEPTANITYWCFVSIKGNSELLSLSSFQWTSRYKTGTPKNWKEIVTEKSLKWIWVTLSRLENPQTHCFWTQWRFWTKSLGPYCAAVINGERSWVLATVISSHCTAVKQQH